ncbi:MAG: tRNA pseudouridine synthase [Acidobacteria bacterium]|nr:tRNA pseudouridine synthase [Acidobacteriota bacterium]
MNFKLLIQYDGTDFHGWQIQGNQRTVQGELQRVLSLLEDRDVHVAGSGRTDAGVHAEGQVATVKIIRSFTPEKLRGALNGNLWRDVRVLQIEKASDDFHARFSAKGKTYLYRVVNSPVISPFLCRFAHHDARPLDVGRMSDAARLFLGKHDWTAFSNANSDAESRVRTITDISVESHWSSQANAAIIEFRITGDGFLRYMVRSIVGTLLEVGRGEKDFDTIQTAIVGGDRKLAGATAPANGLTLLKVYYE